jgi:signal transduction histidine kinase
VKLHLTHQSILRYVFILSIGISLMLFSDYLGFFEGIDHYLYDLSFRVRGPLETDKRIIIAAIDEKTLDALGRWPIRRASYARLLEAVKEAKVVGIDIIMAERSDDDAILDTAMQKHGSVVLPVYIESQLNISYPAKTLSSAKTGHIHVEQGIDGVVRKVFRTLSYRDTILPSFSSVMYELLANTMVNRQKAAGMSDGHTVPRTILQLDPMNINYFGPPGSFQQISLFDVISGKYPQSFFYDKILLVGVTTPGIEEKMLTPFTQHRDRMAGVEVHANILNSMISHNAIHAVHDSMRWFFAVIVSVLCFFLFAKSSERKATLFWTLSLITVAVSVFIIFSVMNVWASPALVYVLLTVMFLTAHIVRLEEMGNLLSMANDEWDRTFNDINDAIIVHDCDFTIVRANKAAEEIRKTRFFEQITMKCREQFMGGQGSLRRFSALPPPELSNPFTMEMFDAERNQYWEILTIPRLDNKNRMAGVIQIIRDVTERKRAEEAIRRNEEQLRNLTAYIQKVSEIERTNIAREIHDELGQALTVLKIDLSWLRKRLLQDQIPMMEKIDAMSKIIDRTIMTVKKISTDLRPGLLDDLGLSAAIEWQSEEFEKRTGIACRIKIEPKEITFDKDRNTALFRILQETLTNIARHAEATEVDVSLQKKDGLIELSVQDNGRGITEEELASPQSYGLMGLRERAILFGGNAVIQGVPGRGTTVTVKIPAENVRENS